MKKLISALVVLFCMISSTYAFSLAFGARGILGKDMDSLSSLNVNNVFNSETSAGFGAYVNLGLFGGLGVQGEVNVNMKNVMLIPYTNIPVQYDYASKLIDVPVMLWLQLSLWKFSVGVGLGPNFSFDLNPFFNVTNGFTVNNLTTNGYTYGAVGGADVKFYFTKHIGLVASARVIFDIGKGNNNSLYYIDSTGNINFNYNIIAVTRKTIYGGLGIEFKLF
jgi:hypothetical protein